MNNITINFLPLSIDIPDKREIFKSIKTRISNLIGAVPKDFQLYLEGDKKSCPNNEDTLEYCESKVEGL